MKVRLSSLPIGHPFRFVGYHNYFYVVEHFLCDTKFCRLTEKIYGISRSSRIVEVDDTEIQLELFNNV